MLDLGECSTGKTAEKDPLYRVFKDLENEGEFENEPTRFKHLEPNSTRESVEACNGDHSGGWGEEELLEFENFASFFLDFHVIVEAMVTDSDLLFGNGCVFGEEASRC